MCGVDISNYVTLFNGGGLGDGLCFSWFEQGDVEVARGVEWD